MVTRHTVSNLKLPSHHAETRVREHTYHLVLKNNSLT